MRRLRIFATLFSLLCLCMTGCASRAAAPRAPERVPAPVRPAFVLYEDGDFLCMSEAARQRVAERHTQVTWYMKELESVVRAYEQQAGNTDGR